MKKKIVLAIPTHASYFLPMMRALRYLNMEVYHFDYLRPDILSRVIGTISNFKGVNKQMKSFLNNRVNEQAINMVTRVKPDYFLTIKGEVFTSEAIERINRMGIVAINWFPDNLALWNLLIKTAHYYSHYFSVCRYLTKKLNDNKRKTSYLPLADDADEKIITEPKIYNLVFAGHKTQRRIEYFSKLLALGFDLWGFPHWQQTSLAPYYHGYISATKMKCVFRQAKIVVNVSTGESKTLIDSANLRNFEATAIGAFILSEYSTALAQLFQEDKEMVFFRSKNELEKKARYYLAHDKEREQIALNGWRKTRKEHTFRHRFTEMFKEIEKNHNI